MKNICEDLSQHETWSDEQTRILALVRPTRAFWADPAQLEELEPFFQEGRQYELDPIVLIKDPKTEELLLFDGNHRMVLAAKYSVSIPFRIYNVGDVHKDSRGEFTITKALLNETRECRQWAQQRGSRLFKNMLPRPWISS